MSILKHILSPFVEFKDEQNQEQKSKSNSEALERSQNDLNPVSNAPVAARMPDTSPSPSAPVSAAPVSSASVSSVPASPGTSADYSKHFEDLINEANTNNPVFQGIDFKEFVDSKADVESIADEGTRYRTAFSVLKRVGLTKERLVSTAREYLNIIENDIKGFEAAYTNQYKTSVEQKENLLQKKTQDVQELNKKIADLNQEIQQMSQEIIQSKEKLSVNKNLFIAAGESKKNEIQTELQKIDQYFS